VRAALDRCPGRVKFDAATADPQVGRNGVGALKDDSPATVVSLAPRPGLSGPVIEPGGRWKKAPDLPANSEWFASQAGSQPAVRSFAAAQAQKEGQACTLT